MSLGYRVQTMRMSMILGELQPGELCPATELVLVQTDA